MKRYGIAVLVGVLLPLGSVFAVEAIPSFDAVVSVHTDATIDVTERILYDFGAEERHGIFRTIPYSYQAGTETYTAEISLVSVADADGEPIPFTQSRGQGALTLKIGDPDLTVTGEKLYEISYTVTGPFLYFDANDELYWNVTGSWDRDISKASVLINLPTGAKVIDAACYQGSFGDTTRCDTDEKLINAERAGYVAYANDLAPKESLTVAVSFPKNTIAVLHKPWEEEKGFRWYDFVPFAAPLIALLFLVRLWYTRGRDPKGRETIVPEYEPPQNVSPAIAGIVYNERIEPREISAEILRCAVDGYIRIHHIEEKGIILTLNDYLLERTDKAEPEDAITSLILRKLFQPEFSGTAHIDGTTIHGTLLSKLRHAFVKERDEISDALYGEVLAAGYFVERPDAVRKRYAIVGGAILALSLVLFDIYGAMYGIAGVLTGALISIGGWLMPARTLVGVRLKEHLEGFKRYLDVAEKDRLAFHNAPEKTPTLFDAYLPYAVAFGVEQAWAEQFNDIHLDAPRWYTGPLGTSFSATAFASDIGTFATDFSSATAPASSGAGGGGHVGGGFGGGGGGSW